MEAKQIIIEEREMKVKSGMGMLLGLLFIMILDIAAFVGTVMFLAKGEAVAAGVILILLEVIVFVAICIMFGGLKVLNPNEAYVLTLFGKYVGTLKNDGFFWVNPFCSAINPAARTTISVASAATSAVTGVPAVAGTSSMGPTKKVSLKATTLENRKQKVNDELGNPIEIGAVVIWKVNNAAKAVFNVDNYKTYISIQCDSVIRNVARCYPYDINESDVESSNEKSLRGSSQEVADIMKRELQEKVDLAGVEVLEVRITHLSYAPEIASAMLQRQQAVAIIAARQKIVEGAVGMVEMALNQLSQNQIVELDDERKAAMVSNLLVVLCGNKDAQPIVNSGSIY